MVGREKSTIGRTALRLRWESVRAGLWLSERAAPELAARWAARLWCTPPRPGRNRSTGPAARPGERFLTSLVAGRPVWRLGGGRQLAVPVAGREMVVAEVWGDGPATTYLLHGWGGWRGQLGALVEPLLAAGQRVVALDAPGHGESGAGRLGGRRTTLTELAEALVAVVAVTGPAHAVVAHSAGGNAALVAVRDGLATGRLVLIAPMADPVPYLDQFTRTLGLGRRTVPRFLRRVERLAGRQLADFDLPARLAADRADPSRRWPPLLVVHDRADRETRYPDGQALAAAWPGARLLGTTGLGHRRILADPDVIDATVSFVTASTVTASVTAAATPGVSAVTGAGSSPRS